MRVLQIPRQQRERQGDEEQELEVLFILVRKRQRIGFVHGEIGGGDQQAQRARRQHVRKQGKIHGVRPQRGQPHHQDHAERRAQIPADQRAPPGQPVLRDQYAAREEEQKIEYAEQTKPSNGANEE